MSLMLRLYAGLAGLAAGPLQRRLRRRAQAGKEIAARLGEREGRDDTPRPAGRLVWLHAASVGETVSILPVIVALGLQGVTVLVTTGTVTSATLLAQRVDLQAGRVLHRFVPLDVPAWAERFVAHWRPDAAGFVESEIWPNLLACCHRHRVPVMLINARLSPSSARAWGRVPGTARRVFGGFAEIQAQSTGDAILLSRLSGRSVVHPGNLKFAAEPLPVATDELDRLRGLIGDRPVWLAASTHPGEEAIAARVHNALISRYPRLLTIIAPRHPERGEEIAAELAMPRRALGEDPPLEGGLWLADTLGEMGLLYRLAGLAFVGCSLAVGGGHNPIEPAQLGCATCIGPMTANCAEAVATLRAIGALDIVEDEAVLLGWVDALLDDPARRAAMGAAGQAAAGAAAGLPEQIAARLLALAG